MTTTLEMIESSPASRGERQAMAQCIDRCLECHQRCGACADACLSEEMVADLRRCIRLDLDCAAICAMTAEVLSRQTEPDPALLEAVLRVCATACEQCASECEGHAEMHDHCRICAEACRACAQACHELLG